MRRSLRVGIDDAAPIPMQAGDPASGTFHGYEGDLLESVAERLGFELVYRRALWSRIVEELVSGGMDVVCSAATVTPEREAQVDFCAPHLRLQLASVTRSQTEAGQAQKVSRFGVRGGTTAESFLRSELGSQPAMVSESNDELYQALSYGEVDAVIDDSPIAMHFAKAVPGLRYGDPYANTQAAYAIMVAKERVELQRALNGVLADLEEDGTLPSLRERWFGSAKMLVA